MLSRQCDVTSTSKLIKKRNASVTPYVVLKYQLPANLPVSNTANVHEPSRIEEISHAADGSFFKYEKLDVP